MPLSLPTANCYTVLLFKSTAARSLERFKGSGNKQAFFLLNYFLNATVTVGDIERPGEDLMVADTDVIRRRGLQRAEASLATSVFLPHMKMCDQRLIVLQFTTQSTVSLRRDDQIISVNRYEIILHKICRIYSLVLIRVSWAPISIIVLYHLDHL